MDPELQPQAPEQLGQPENTYYDIVSRTACTALFYSW